MDRKIRQIETEVYDLESKMFDVMVALVNAAARYNSDNVNAYVGTLKILDREYREKILFSYVNWKEVDNIVTRMNTEIEAINNARLK